MKKKDLRKLKTMSTSEIKDDFQHIEFSVILVEPQGPINIGMIARSMKNFGFKNLIIFNPQCEVGSDARKFSMHGLDILKIARIIRTQKNNSISSLNQLFQEFDFVIGTSAKQTRFNNIKRIAYYVDEVDLSLLNSPGAKIALVFGREDTGLYNAELEICDYIIKIPVSDEYPALNLSHAVSIILFSFYKKLRRVQKGDVIPSSYNDREQLIRILRNTLNIFDYRLEASDKLIQAMQNILGRSFSSLKEINLLISLFSEINKKSRN